MEQNHGADFESTERVTESKFLELKELYRTAISADDDLYFSAKMKKIFDHLKEKYSTQDLINCRLWHVIALSTPSGNETTLDMPGGEIDEFIRSEFG